MKVKSTPPRSGARAARFFATDLQKIPLARAVRAAQKNRARGARFFTLRAERAAQKSLIFYITEKKTQISRASAREICVFFFTESFAYSSLGPSNS